MRTNKSNELEALFDHLPHGIITITASKPRVISNINVAACNILETEKKKILGKKIELVFREKYLALLAPVKETIEQKRSIRNFNLELGTGPEDSRAFLINTVFLDDAASTGKSIILILHDMSEVSQRKQRAYTERFEALVGNTAAMRKVFSTIETVAPTNAAVLIYGETGTGKELVARAIHERSNRANKPFIPVHCSAITSSLLESDLFGHTKGAFTGAIRDKPGRFEMADGGTIFLDEIATLTPEIQVNLLRVLQEKTIEKVGGTKSISVDVRIISASNKRLPELIRQGVFRKDLYYRIKVLQIDLPPLRKRKKDIPLLADHFIQKYNGQHDCSISGMTNEAKRILRIYSWPGNVRELENAIEHAVILAQNNLIESWHLPTEIRELKRNSLTFDPEDATELSPADEAERIRNTLRQTAGNVTRAADILGIHRTTLWRKMRELGIPRLPQSL